MFIPFRTRSKVDGYSLRSKTEAKCSDLPDAKSCMLFPHLTLDLQRGKQLKTENIESDVTVKFPEKSVLLQAQDGNDETQNESSLSSATSKTDSLKKVCKRIGDSSVVFSDEAAITWSGREEEKSEPTKELSPYYATTQEKQAFNKIKVWRERFSVQLDKILQQRQGLSQLPDKNTKNKLDMKVSTSHHHDCRQEATPYKKPTTSLPARKSLPEKQATAHNMQHRLISELRAFSQVSVKSKEGSQNSNKGKIILQEIKRQRGQVKCVHDDNDLKEEIESLEKQESQRIFHPWSKSDTNKDIDSFQKETALKRNREVGMKIDNKQNLSSTDALSTTYSQASESQVKEVLYSLRKTIDTIFTSTIQRISDLMVITGSSESYSEISSQHYDQLLLRKMEVAKEERDNLCLENMNLKKEISDLKRQLAKTLDEGAGDISIGRVDSLKSTDSLVSQTAGVYVRIDEIHRVVSHFKEFAGGYRPNVEGALSAESYGTYASNSRPENFVACSKIDRCTKPPIKTQMTMTACSCNMLMKSAHFTQELEFSAFWRPIHNIRMLEKSLMYIRFHKLLNRKWTLLIFKSIFKENKKNESDTQPRLPSKLWNTVFDYLFIIIVISIAKRLSS